MRSRSLFVLTFVVLGSSSCAKRVPKPANLVPGVPNVTWVLMYGDRDNADSEFACQSDPRTECVIPASKPDARVFSDIHFYFHGAGAETRYEGSMKLGYLQGGPDSPPSRTDITVRKNESITNSSTTGIVTSTPGAYAVTISLTATLKDAGKTRPISETIPVTVR